MRIPFLSDYLNYRKDLRVARDSGYRDLSEFHRASIEKFKDGHLSLFDLHASTYGYSGESFLNGFGITKDFRVFDLKLLQYRSIQLRRENLYAATIFNRLETKVINKGLQLNVAPLFPILNKKYGITNDWIREWSRMVEARFTAFSSDKKYISHDKKMNFNKLQQRDYNTSLLSGDSLVLSSLNQKGLPVFRIIDGFYISQPLEANGMRGKDIKQGVEVDKYGAEIAYWVENGEGKHTRIPKYDRRTKRERAILNRSTEQRVDDVRGMPVLGLGMQNISEAGKYLDSEQRAALVNSNVAMSRNRDKNQGPLSAGGDRFGFKSSVTVKTQDTPERNVKFEEQTPGLFLANLAPGESIQSYDTKRPNINFGPFMDTTLKPLAYSLGMPPEQFFLEYGNNFSASRMAQIDSKDNTDLRAYNYSIQTPKYAYENWFIGEVLNGSIKAPGFVDSLNNPHMYDVRNAWLNATWRGLPVVNVDIKKQVTALGDIADRGWMTNEDISQRHFGVDYYDNLNRIQNENEARNKAFASPDTNVEENGQMVRKLDYIIKKIDSVQADVEDLQDNESGQNE